MTTSTDTQARDALGGHGAHTDGGRPTPSATPSASRAGVIELFHCAPLSARLTASACAQRYTLASRAALGTSISTSPCRACPVGAAHARGERPTAWAGGGPLERLEAPQRAGSMNPSAGGAGHAARRSATSTATAAEGGRRKAETVRAQAGAARGPVQQQEGSMPKAIAIEWNGETKGAGEWARIVGVSSVTILKRHKQGKNPDGTSRGGEPATSRSAPKKSPARRAPARNAKIAAKPSTTSPALPADAFPRLLEAFGIETRPMGELDGWQLTAWRSST
jgi:hypothetical protein